MSVKTLNLRPGETTVEISAFLPALTIEALKNRVVVAINAPQEKQGLIYVHANSTPDVARVLKAGKSFTRKTKKGWVMTKDGREVKPPATGDYVLFRPDRGVRIADADLGSAPSPWLTGIFGVALVGDGGAYGCVAIPWWNDIMAVLDTDGNIVRMTGDNVLIRRDSTVTSEGGILLPDEIQYDSGMGTVEAVGDLVEELSPGDRVSYSVDGSKYAFEISGDKSLAIVKERAVLYKVIQ